MREELLVIGDRVFVGVAAAVGSSTTGASTTASAEGAALRGTASMGGSTIGGSTMGGATTGAGAPTSGAVATKAPDAPSCVVHHAPTPAQATTSTRAAISAKAQRGPVLGGASFTSLGVTSGLGAWTGRGGGVGEE